jgi:hypothetical protein
VKEKRLEERSDNGNSNSNSSSNNNNNNNEKEKTYLLAATFIECSKKRV